MALEAAFRVLCAGSGNEDPELMAIVDMHIVPLDGPPLACHRALLSARCELLPVACVEIRAEESTDVVCILLQWICCGTLRADVISKDLHQLGFRAAALGERWGLRDATSIRARLVGGGTTGKLANCVRARSSLRKDLLRAYDAGVLGSLTLLCEGCEEPLSAGWWPCLAARSSYFRAMLCGPWAEAAERSAQRAKPLPMQWPRAEVRRLLRFLHGCEEFVTGIEDVRLAVHLADYFGVPALLGHVNDWIVEHLTTETAPSLWRLLEETPQLREVSRSDEHLDADCTCLEYHARHFPEIAGMSLDYELPPEDAEEPGSQASFGRHVPLNNLSRDLMHRLLASGLVNVPFQAMLPVVANFAAQTTGSHAGPNYSKLYEELTPPRVMFNRQIRDALCGGRSLNGRTLAGGI